MSNIEIIRLTTEPTSNVHGPRITVDDTIQKAVRALKEELHPEHFVLGTEVQDKTVIQITVELGGAQDNVNSKRTPEPIPSLKSVRSLFGEPHDIFHVALDQPAFGPDGSATANVVEYAQTYFPASSVTPEFQLKVEEDFFRFDEIFSKVAEGSIGWTFGWVQEEQEHEHVTGEKARCFLVMRGWESMARFEQSVKSDTYKKALPILLAWNAPFKMVCLCFTE